MSRRIKCLLHSETCTQICLNKECNKKLLCERCILQHDVLHLTQIHPLKDMDQNISQIPILIEKVYRNCDIGIGAFEIKSLSDVKPLCSREGSNKKISIHCTQQNKNLEIELSYVVDEFQNEIVKEVEKYYKYQEEQFALIISVLHDHLMTVTPYATANRPASEIQFSLMMDFQEQMLTNIMPTLNKKAQVLHDKILSNPLQMKSDHFHALILTYLKKGFQPHNLFANNEFQIAQRQTLEHKLEDQCTKSAVFQSHRNDDVNMTFYRNQAQRILQKHLILEDIQTIQPLKSNFYGLQKDQKSKQANIQVPVNYDDFQRSNLNVQLNNILTGHTDIITSICILSPTKIASASGDGVIKIWDVDSAIAVTTMTGHIGDVWELVPIQKYNENITQFASCGSDKTVRIWSIDKRICLTQFVGHLDVIRCICYIPDLDYIVSGGKDKMIKIWNLARQRQQSTIDDAHKQLIKCFCYIEVKGLLLSGSADSSIKVWNIMNNNTLRDKLEGHRGEVCCLKHMQDTLMNESISLVASGGTDQKIIIWNIDQGIKIAQLIGHMDTITSIDYNLEKLHLWSVGADRTVRIWDWYHHKQIRIIKRHGDIISSIKLIKSRGIVVTGSWDHKIRVTGQEYYYTSSNS